MWRHLEEAEKCLIPLVRFLGKAMTSRSFLQLRLNERFFSKFTEKALVFLALHKPRDCAKSTTLGIVGIFGHALFSFQRDFTENWVKKSCQELSNFEIYLAEGNLTNVISVF